MERRDFSKTADGALAAGVLPRAAAQTVSRTQGQASYAGLGRPHMKWAVQHSMQISDLNPQTLQLAKQLGTSGSWLEGGASMGRNVLETIEYSGGIKKLFVVHFRNVSAPLPRFYETYINEAYTHMYKCASALSHVRAR